MGNRVHRCFLGGVALLLIMLSVAVHAWSAAKADDAGGPTIADLPKILPQVTKAAVNIYELAKNERWEKALLAVEEIKSAIPKFYIEGYEPSKLYAAQLQLTAGDLTEAASGEDKHNTMLLANRITLFTAGMAAPLGLSIPTPVELLYFYGRELEIWSDVDDTAKLADTVAGIDKAWGDLLPMLQARGQDQEIRTFTATLEELKAAKTSPEYAALAKPLMSEAQKIERSFSPKRKGHR